MLKVVVIGVLHGLLEMKKQALEVQARLTHTSKDYTGNAVIAWKCIENEIALVVFTI